MPVTAQAEITIDGLAEAVFSQFVDYRTWIEWMPPVFRPVRGPARELRRGDRIVVRIGGALPSLITVDRLQAPREVRWSGGLPGVLFARHTFLFDELDESRTRIRSIEPWTGLVTFFGPAAGRVLRAAEAGGRAQLSGFARWYAQIAPPPPA